MEIRIESPKKNLNFTIKSNKINGIITANKEEFAYRIYLKNRQDERVYIDGEEVTNPNIFKEKIKLILEEMNPLQFRYKVYECMYREIQRNELALENPQKKVLDSLKIVGLDITYLTRNIPDLSTSERKLLQIGMTLMTNPEVIIMIEPFKSFDMKTQRRMISLLEIMKEQYDKTIIMISDDTDMLYQYTEHLIIEKNHKIVLEGNSKELLERVDFLKKQGIEVPNIVEFTNLAKEKNVKIEYHKDIRDLIKDIYKHV